MNETLDWSNRYLALATGSVVATALTWTLNRELVVPVALATAMAFAALALLHARISERQFRKV